MHFVSLLLALLLAAPQRIPVDTTEALPAPVVETVDSLMNTPQETFGTRPRLETTTPADEAEPAPVPQQIPEDTLREETAARADTSAATSLLPPATPPVVPQRNEGPSEVERLIEGMGAEIDQFQEGMTRQMEQLLGTFTLTRFLLLLLMLAFAYMLIRFIIVLLGELGAWRPAWRPWLRKALPFVRFGLWLFALWLIVGTLFGGSTLLFAATMLLVFAAIVFALFQFMRDLVGGLVLLLEQPFQVGSRVRVGEQGGQVVRIGLRSFKLMTPEGAFVVVPNAEVLRRAITSTTPETAESRVSVMLAFPEALSVDEAARLAREAAYTSPYIYSQKPVTVRLADTETGHPQRLAITAHVFDDQHADALASDILRIASGAFDRYVGSGSS